MTTFIQILTVIGYLLFFRHASFAKTDLNDIVLENQRKGTSEWWYAQPMSSESIEIVKRYQGFSTQFSFLPGETVSFKLNILSSSNDWLNLSVYRLGFYQGLGGRHIDSIEIDRSTPTQPPCLYEPTARLVDCDNWKITANWTIPRDAMTGVYVALLHDNHGNRGSYIPFVLRRDIKASEQHDILFKTADTTWVAYNKYGSWNVYRGNGSFTFDSRADKASYNRPFANRLPKPNGQHENFLFGSEYAMLYWLEKHGYEVSYASCYDVERYLDDNVLTSFKILLSVGHDEYWTQRLKDAYTYSRNNGVNLAFFSANEIFWRIRWQSKELSYIAVDGVTTVTSTDGVYILATEKDTSSRIVEPRVIICKKESIDDVSSASAEEWTGTFIDPRHRPPDPTNALTGQYFMVNGFRNDSIHVRLDFTTLRFWRETALSDGPVAKGYWTGAGILGYEWNIYSDDCYRPAGLFSLSWTTMKISHGLLENYGASYRGSDTVSHHLSMYRHISPDYDPTAGIGKTALVFATGTIQWSWALSSLRDGHGLALDLNLQQATINLLADMHVLARSLQSDGGLLQTNTSEDIIPPVSTIFHSFNRRCSPSIIVHGEASDEGGGRIAAVEVSFDNGTTWNIAKGREIWSIRYHFDSSERKDCSSSSKLHWKYELGSAPRNMILAASSRADLDPPGREHIDDGRRSLWIISRAVDDSGWIEGCCGYHRRGKDVTNRLHISYTCSDLH
jgi:hypothetical protein